MGRGIIKNAIEISGLCKEYKTFAIRDLSFNVPAGSITGFIGQNGAGNYKDGTETISLAYIEAALGSDLSGGGSPEKSNPNLVPIGEGFGFVLYLKDLM